MNKKFLLLILCLLMVGSVYALGVSPGRTTVSFEPGLHKEVTFEVINSWNKDMTLIITAQGELAEYVSIPSSSVFVSASEYSKTLSYSVDLPISLEPGLRTADIFVVEVPTDKDSNSSAVLATLAVVTQLYVQVPYPGKFAEADMVVYDASRGGDVKFVFPVISRGEFDLTSVKANVDIYNSLNEKIDSFNTQTMSIESAQRKELVYNWKADVPIGNYRASASVVYDEGVIPLEATFSVGDKDLELQEISVNKFSLGEIVKLNMLVENKWSEPISDAYISTKIKNSRGDVVSSFDSATYNLAALSKQAFVSYWDTAGVRAGDYQTEISINYGDKSSTKNLEFQVSENNLVVIGLGYVISEGDSEGGMSGLILVLIVIIVLLVLINVVWFFLLRKRLKK
jgi:hypothetical protein